MFGSGAGLWYIVQTQYCANTCDSKCKLILCKSSIFQPDLNHSQIVKAFYYLQGHQAPCDSMIKYLISKVYEELWQHYQFPKQRELGSLSPANYEFHVERKP